MNTTLVATFIIAMNGGFGSTTLDSMEACKERQKQFNKQDNLYKYETKCVPGKVDLTKLTVESFKKL